MEAGRKAGQVNKNKLTRNLEVNNETAERIAASMKSMKWDFAFPSKDKALMDEEHTLTTGVKEKLEKANGQAERLVKEAHKCLERFENKKLDIHARSKQTKLVGLISDATDAVQDMNRLLTLKRGPKGERISTPLVQQLLGAAAEKCRPLLEEMAILKNYVQHLR